MDGSRSRHSLSQVYDASPLQNKILPRGEARSAGNRCASEADDGRISLYTLLANSVSLEEAVWLAAVSTPDIRMHEDGAHHARHLRHRAANVRRLVEDAGLRLGLTTYWELGASGARAQLGGIARSLHTAAVLGRASCISSADYSSGHD